MNEIPEQSEKTMTDKVTIDFFDKEPTFKAEPILDEQAKEQAKLNMKIAIFKALPLKIKITSILGISFILYIVGSGLVWNIRMLINLF